MLYAFQSELTALERFIEVLHDEQSALTTADIDSLVKLTREKSDLSEQLNHLAKERVSALQKRGVKSDRASMEAWLAGQPNDIVAAWNALMERAEAAQELNRTNGKLIASQLQQTQQALNVLASAANQSTVYGADGQTRGIQPNSRRTLGKG